jgi:uncharacterized membrane protein
MLEKLKKTKLNLSKKQLFVISLTFLLHSLGVLVAYFQTENNELPFSPHFQVIRLFTWWSVHASVLAIITLIMII